MVIKTPVDLKAAIEIAIVSTQETNPTYLSIIWDIHKYKWYNFYQNLYIKENSPEDIENKKIFAALEVTHPTIHNDIESNIEYEIRKLSCDFDLD